MCKLKLLLDIKEKCLPKKKNIWWGWGTEYYFSGIPNIIINKHNKSQKRQKQNDKQT
jgi:hypothetical protein